MARRRVRGIFGDMLLLLLLVSISVDIDCNGFFLVVLSLLLSCCVVDGSGCVVSGEESDGESILFHNLIRSIFSIFLCLISSSYIVAVQK